MTDVHFIHRDGREIDLPADDQNQINTYRAMGFGPRPAIEANLALEAEQEADRTEAVEAYAQAANAAAAVREDAEAAGYAAWTRAELREEITTRNAGRDEADHIKVSGNKPELVDALQADDQAQQDVSDGGAENQ